MDPLECVAIVQLLLLRHGVAVDRQIFAAEGGSDRDRPLTDDGRRRTRRCVRRLRSLVPKLDVVATSPWLRAQQTAQLLQAAYGTVTLTELEALRPDRPLEEIEAFLRALPLDSRVALVGHRPDLEILAAWLTSGVSTATVELKKAGSALIEFSGIPGRGRGVLRWLLQPAQLRRMR